MTGRLRAALWALWCRAWRNHHPYPVEAAEAPNDGLPVARSGSWAGQALPGREQVIRHVTFQVVGYDRTIPGYLRYRRSDPYAVRFVFAEADELIPWDFARELLHTAVVDRMPSGLADVRWHERDRLLVLDLSSHDGEATLTIPRTEVAAFLADTYTVVPRGNEAEHLGLDEALAELLAREAL